MQSQRAFDLSCADAVATDIDDIIHPASDPVVAVLIPSAPIPCEVVPLHTRTDFSL